MKQTDKTELDSIQKKLQRQSSLLKKYRTQDTHLKWLVGLGGVAILLLVLWLGLATDWTAGLRKDKVPATATVAGNAGTIHGTIPTASGASTSGSGGTTPNGESSNTSTRTNGATTTGTTNSSTTNNSTTSTTTNATTPPNAVTTGISDLYNSTAAGDTIDSVLKYAESLGVPSTCSTSLLIQTCAFTQNGNTITVRNLAGSGLVTGVTKNF